MKIAECLPPKLQGLVKYLDKLQQIRLVANSPVRLKLDGINMYMGEFGLQNSPCGAVRVVADEIDTFIKTACQNSIYAFQNQLSNGYLTLDDGCRIGVGGRCSSGVDGEICFSSYTSACIRINKHVQLCSSGVSKNDLSSNILVVGLPGYGKTTFLRDLAIRASKVLDVAVLDERGELTLVEGFATQACCDVLLHLERQRAVILALRSLSPEVIVCDEIFDVDAGWLGGAMQSGVNVYASLHSTTFNAAKEFCDRNGLNFDFFVVLEQFGGKMAKLYDKLGNYITL